MLDLRTALLLAGVMALTFGAVLLGLRRSLALQGTGVRRWAEGDLIGGFAMVLLGLRQALPDFATIVAGNVLLIAGIALQHRALRSFLGLPRRTRLEIIAITCGIGQAVLFWYWYDLPGVRTVAITAIVVTLYASIAATALARSLRTLPGARLLGGTVVALSLLAVVRTAVILGVSGVDADSLKWHPIQVPFFYSFTVFVALLNLAFVVMLDSRRHSDLERLASIDALTGLLNRRMLMTLAEKALAQAQRSGRPLALLMLDLDRFKMLNDRHGHSAGDAALALFARTVENELRAGDVLGRYGGEEFMVVLPDTTLDDAVAIAERTRMTVERDATRPGARPACTVSIGVTAADSPRTITLDALIRQADVALYCAKRTRNRIATYTPDTIADAADVTA